MSKKTNICCVCSGEGASKCARCKQVTYCSITCQKKHWKEHKSVCVPARTNSTCVCPICGRDGLEEECPYVCVRCPKLAITMCEACFADKRTIELADNRRFCSPCAREYGRSADWNHLRQVLAESSPLELPHAKCIRLGLACTQPVDPGQPFSPVLQANINKDELLNLANKENYAPAMFVLGILYGRLQMQSQAPLIETGSFPFLFAEEQNPFPKDLVLSEKYLKRASRRGYAPAMYRLGYHYQRGPFARPADDQVLLRLFRDAANAGNVAAAALYSQHLALTGGDSDEAIRVMKRIVRKSRPEFAAGFRAALESLGETIDENEDPEDMVERAWR